VCPAQLKAGGIDRIGKLDDLIVEEIASRQPGIGIFLNGKKGLPFGMVVAPGHHVVFIPSDAGGSIGPFSGETPLGEDQWPAPRHGEVADQREITRFVDAALFFILIAEAQGDAQHLAGVVGVGTHRTGAVTAQGTRIEVSDRMRELRIGKNHPHLLEIREEFGEEQGEPGLFGQSEEVAHKGGFTLGKRSAYVAEEGMVGAAEAQFAASLPGIGCRQEQGGRGGPPDHLPRAAIQQQVDAFHMLEIVKDQVTRIGAGYAVLLPVKAEGFGQVVVAENPVVLFEGFKAGHRIVSHNGQSAAVFLRQEKELRHIKGFGNQPVVGGAALQSVVGDPAESRFHQVNAGIGTGNGGGHLFSFGADGGQLRRRQRLADEPSRAGGPFV